jgi:hypothetical protein
VAIGALALAWVTASAARGDAERFRFVYRAPPGCPDERTFVETVAEHIDRGRLASSSDAHASTMSIDVTVGQGESSGRLEFIDAANGETVVRAVAGRTCDEIVSGLALIAALAIEARAPAEPAPEAPAEDPPAPSHALPETLPEKSAAVSRVRFGAGVSGGVDSSSSPGAAFAAGIDAEVAWRAPLRFARLGARRVANDVSLNDRSASFTRWAARLEACPISLVLSPRLEMPACAALELGQLSGAGRASAALLDPQSAKILWTAAEASAGLRWEPDLWWIEARGSAGLPLVRHNFVFRGPAETVFEVPVVGWGLAVQIGAHFP